MGNGLKNTTASSANIDVLGTSGLNTISESSRLPVAQDAIVCKTTIAKMKRADNSRSPWCTPQARAKASDY